MRCPANGMARSSSRPGVLSAPGVRVLVAVALTVAVTGYFVGLRESRQTSVAPRLLPSQEPSSGDKSDQKVVDAVAYADLAFKKLGPNRDWHVPLDQLAQPSTAAAPKEAPTPAQRAQCLAERGARRAFEGAPPVIPHPIASQGTAVCLACHEKGLVIGSKVASKMSHPPYALCTQCHVEMGPGGLKDAAPAQTVPADRAFAGAPPALPHAMWMRENCLNCHGPTGHAGLRTTHPERLVCVQCHAASAPLDAVPRTAPPPKETP